MIAKIIKGSDYQGAVNLVRYLLSPKSATARKANLKVHSTKGERVVAIDSDWMLPAIPGESISQSSLRIADDLFHWNESHREGKNAPKHPFIHGSISWALSDQVTPELALDICREVVGTVMPGDRPVLYVVHGDTAHFHVHFLAGSVSSQGTCWNLRHDFRKWESAMESMEKRYHFARVEKRKSESKINPERQPMERRPNQAEYKFEERTGLTSDKSRLKQLIDNVLKGARSLDDFCVLLELEDVKVEFNEAKTGHISGIGYRFRDRYYKGSTLGKKYAYREISRQFDDADKIIGSQKFSNENPESRQGLIIGNVNRPRNVCDQILLALKGGEKRAKRNKSELSAGNDLQLKSTWTPPETL